MKKFIVILAALIFIGAVVFFASGWLKKNKKTGGKQRATVSTGQTLAMPADILASKFGFLSGGPGEYKDILSRGSQWVRPHPGPFLWDAMQKDKTSEIDFSQTDTVVQGYQEGKLGILATLWPFADWDQKSKSDYEKCAVSPNDEFLAKNDKKGRGDYLPLYRCNPENWNAYQNWLTKVVERYNGDGKNDMEGLQYPIKHWEVMNEPDLVGGPSGEEQRLKFYQGNPADYGKLLIKTAQVIRSVDPQAKIVIAGAAGGNSQFLDFYRQVLQNKDTVSAFDIGNIHCISNDDFDSFNVEPYKKMLSEFNISKPIWVTEAEAIVSTDQDINATQLAESTKKALALGVERIFFTRYDFAIRNDLRDKPKPEGESKAVAVANSNLAGKSAEQVYQIITKGSQ